MAISSRQFLADAMLGKLARWLRMLGYDTAYENTIADESLIDRVVGEERWLLTRDTYLAKRKVLRGRHTLLTSDTVSLQLQQLVRDLSLELPPNERRPPRCPKCNDPLRPLSHADAAREVPPFVASQHQEFVRCGICGRIYWPGSHWEHIVRTLEGLGP
jgi:uncharacterized protein with PIN domain